MTTELKPMPENTLKDFAKECLDTHEYGSNEYKLAAFYLANEGAIPVANLNALLNDWGRLGKENAELTRTSRPAGGDERGEFHNAFWEAYKTLDENIRKRFSL